MSAANRVSQRVHVLDWQNMGGVPADLVALLGTFSLSSGLSAATLAADGYELVTNGNMEAGDPPTGWTAISPAVISSAASERTGGTGARSLSVVNGVSASAGRARQTLSTVAGTWIRFDGWLKEISTYPQIKLENDIGQQIDIFGSTGNWARLIKSILIPSAVLNVFCKNFSSTLGNESLYDDISIQSTIAQLVISTPLLHASHVCSVAWPAAGDVTPFSLYLRGTDALNHWEVRLTPNTAGTDTQIVEHVAGIQTVRASADVDWTASATDMVKVVALGSTISVYHQKSGATGWTAACSYSSATPSSAAMKWGWQLYKTGQTYAKQSIVEALA